MPFKEPVIPRTFTASIHPNHRFGSRSARIFRLLLRKRHLEQKQVEDFAMIPAKEAKDMLYTLMSENLVLLQVRPPTDPPRDLLPPGPMRRCSMSW